jgi:hypothetical protein
MRKSQAIPVLVLLLAGVQGCGSRSDDETVKTFLKNQVDLLNFLKKMKNKETIIQLSDQKDKLKDKTDVDLKALADLRDSLTDEGKLRLQLKYGSAVENVYIALNKELQRILSLAAKGGKGGGPGPMPGGGGGMLIIDQEAMFLLDGYAAMSAIVLQDINDLTTTLLAVQKAEQVQGAIPTLRKLRHRLSVNAAKLEHAQPRRTSVFGQLQDQLKNSLSGPITTLRTEEERVRTLDGGSEAINIVEPLPDQIAALSP